MTENELREAIAIGQEQRGVEFKSPGMRTDKGFQVKVVRAVLGMSNNPGGGVVVIGVDERNKNLRATGLSKIELGTWTYDDFASNVSNFADPYVNFNLGVVEMDKKNFLVIEVKQFDELPVICKKDSFNVLRNGALYVRRRGKNETIEVPSHVEMREIVTRAAEFQARQIVASYVNLKNHLDNSKKPTPKSEELYDSESKDLL